MNTDELLQRLASMQAELASLIDDVRASVVDRSPVDAVAEAAVAEAPAERLPEDLEGARLVALNMAMNGTPREETERYLAENFELENRQLLLDEVYAAVADSS